jgi:hypothetical protein
MFWKKEKAMENAAPETKEVVDLSHKPQVLLMPCGKPYQLSKLQKIVMENWEIKSHVGECAFYYALVNQVSKTVPETWEKAQEIADSYKGEQVWKTSIIAKFRFRIKCWDLERLIGTPCLTDADIIKHFCAAVDDILENDWTVNHSKHIKLYKAKECEYMASVSFDQVIPLLSLKKEYGEEWFWKHLFKDYKPFVWKN